jgi:TonB-linked SusC/RagA family outer membrane protein
MIGVSVSLVGNQSVGTVTDIDGNYSLNVTGTNPVLQFSYIGYLPVKATASTNTLNVTMREDSQLIDEVVVVGYGTQKKVNLTGAVSTVDVDKTLGSRPIADAGRGLQGSVPGLTVVVASGEIGSDPLMKIRGQVGSVNGSANPLILVDNVEVPSIQIINPDDIESVSVLKDAASTSIYGSKAAFGVILITTRKGAETESVTVSYSNNFAWQDRAKALEMGGVDGLLYTLDAARTRNPENPGTAATGNMWKMNEESVLKSLAWVQKYGNTLDPYAPIVFNRDWYVNSNGETLGIRTYNSVDALVDTWTPTSTHNLSVNGKKGTTTFNIGLGILDQSGLTKGAKADDFRRYNASINLSTEVNKYLTVRAGAIYSDRIKRYPTVNSYGADPWLYAYRWGALMPMGVVDQFGNEVRNPAYELRESPTASLRNAYTNINLGATLNITKNWDMKFDYTYWTQETMTDQAYPIFTGGDVWYAASGKIPWVDENGNQVFVDDEGNQVAEGGVPAYRFAQITWPANSWISRESVRNNSKNLNVYSTYNLDIADTHKFKFMIGLNSVASSSRGHKGTITDLYNYDNPQFNYATGVNTVTGSADWGGLLGYFGRVNYSFLDRYLLEANIRRDGTSKFPAHVRWQWFPSFSAGWVLSNESFFKALKPIIYFAKARASWGSVGDQSVSSGLYIASMTRSQLSWLNNAGSKDYAFTTPASIYSDIRWQTIENLDLGIDLQFLKGALGLTFDWFQRDTKDMIISGDALPYTNGAAAPQGNFGNLQTKGWEVSMTYNHRFENGLGINAMATVWDSETFITKGADYKTDWENRSIGSTFATGARYGDIWGYVTDRLYQTDDFVWEGEGADRKMKKVTIIIDGTAKQSYMLAGSNPVYQTRLEDGGGTVIFRPGDVKFVDLNGDGYITPGKGTFGDPGDRKVIGNSTPRYEYGFRLGADYKGFDASVFLQGVGSRQIWGAGQLAIPGYHASDGAIPKAIATDYWREEMTYTIDGTEYVIHGANLDAFYPRAWDNGGADSNYSLQVQSKYLLNMAYLRVKNITIGYSLPTKLLKKVYIGRARIYASLENFITFDNLRGLPIDPEAISGYSMFSTSYNLSRTGTGTPMFKSGSFGVQVSF